MKYDVGRTNQFKRDYKLAKKRGCNIEELHLVIALLADGEELPEKYRDHALTDSREYKGGRECHIEPDWLLVYRVVEDMLLLQLLRTGSHSDLF